MHASEPYQPVIRTPKNISKPSQSFRDEGAEI